MTLLMTVTTPVITGGELIINFYNNSPVNKTLLENNILYLLLASHSEAAHYFVQ